MKAVYIAGPMTGRPAYNVEAFKAAAAEWAARGYYVRTPFDASNTVWLRRHRRPFDPYTDACEYGDPALAEMWAQNMAVLCAADAIVLLDGWERSRGAKLERATAELLGKEIIVHADAVQAA